MKYAAFVAVLMAYGAGMSAAEKCVAIRVTNGVKHTVTYAYGPVSLYADVRVQKDPAHRWLEISYAYAPPDALGADISADDDPMFAMQEPDKQDGADGASLIQLDGDRERLLHQRKLTNMAGGVYVITAVVYRDESRKKICGRATTRVTVR